MIWFTLAIGFLSGAILMDVWRDWLDARMYAQEWDEMGGPQ